MMDKYEAIRQYKAANKALADAKAATAAAQSAQAEASDKFGEAHAVLQGQLNKSEATVFEGEVWYLNYYANVESRKLA